MYSGCICPKWRVIRWKRETESYSRPQTFTIALFSLIVLLLSSFHGVFLTEARFSPEGRWFSHNSGCQDVTVHPQIRVVWGSFCVCCYFSAALFLLTIIGDFRSGIVHCGASAFLPLQSTVVVLVILTTTTYPTTSHRRFAFRALSFASFSPTLFLHHILADPLSAHRRGESEWITRSRSPKHRRGESEWITRSRSPKHRRWESELMVYA